jgi:hypothetical protein
MTFALVSAGGVTRFLIKMHVWYHEKPLSISVTVR